MSMHHHHHVEGYSGTYSGNTKMVVQYADQTEVTLGNFLASFPEYRGAFIVLKGGEPIIIDSPKFRQWTDLYLERKVDLAYIER